MSDGTAQLYRFERALTELQNAASGDNTARLQDARARFDSLKQPELATASAAIDGYASKMAPTASMTRRTFARQETFRPRGGACPPSSYPAKNGGTNAKGPPYNLPEGQSPNGSDLSMGLDKLLKPIMRKSLAGARKALTKSRRIG